MATLVMVATVGAAPATKGPRSAKSGTPNPQKPPYQIGTASWYGKPFHGRATASGEPYDMFQFTAAHRYLPLGTWVKVTNLRNGRWLMVRVNDRGPVPDSRIIDLSYGAAAMLEFRHAGVERVRLDIVSAQMVAAAQSTGGQ
jgi:rare lipoprotein A